MSNQSTQTPLRKHGTRGINIEFANIKQLEKQVASTYKLIEWKEGFTVNDANYQYFVGKSQYGYWLSRKRLPVNIPDMQNTTTSQVTPPQTPQSNEIVTDSTKKEDEMITTLTQRITTMEDEIIRLKNKATTLENWIKKVSQSAVMNQL
jgi:hypothetical protein